MDLAPAREVPRPGAAHRARPRRGTGTSGRSARAAASITVGHTAVAGWKEPFPSAPKRFEEVPKAAYDANARLAYMDSIGVWAMALYPNVGGFGNEAFLSSATPS